MAAELIDGSEMSMVDIIGGSVDKSEQLKLTRLLFRAFRGKVYIDFADIKDKNLSGNKICFIILYEHGEFLERRIRRIMDSF